MNRTISLIVSKFVKSIVYKLRQRKTEKCNDGYAMVIIFILYDL